MKRKVKVNTVGEVIPVLLVVLLLYVILAGSGLLSSISYNSTLKVISVPTGEYFDGYDSRIDIDFTKISNSNIKIDVNSYVPIVKETHGFSWLPCQNNNACVHLDRAGNSVLTKIFVVDIDKSNYLNTVVEDYGKFETGKPFGFFSWNNGVEYKKIAEGMNLVTGYAPCSIGSTNCFKYPISNVSKTVDLPNGHYLVEVRGIAINDFRSRGDFNKVDFADDYWDRNPDERIRGITNKIMFDECVDIDWRVGVSQGFVSLLFSNDLGEYCYGTTNPNLGISDYDYGRDELYLLDSMEFEIVGSVEPPILFPLEPPAITPPTVGLLDGFFAWLNGILKSFIGMFYV